MDAEPAAVHPEVTRLDGYDHTGRSEEALTALAVTQPRIAELLGSQTPREVIAVVDRIVNIVIA